jgi:allantoin racemase
MRKIAYLMEGASTGRLSGELARRERVLREIASLGTEIDIFGLESDPDMSYLGTVQSSYAAALSTIGDLKCAIEAQKTGYEAVIIPCGGDPGIAPLREVLTIPVVPPGSAAKHICSLIGPRFSIITVGDGPVKLPEFHERDGLMKLVSIHQTGLTVPEVRAKPKETYDAMVREGKSAVDVYGAASVTFGCMSMGFLMMDERLSEEIGVPVVNPVKAAVKTAEILIDLNLTHSKRAYPIPPSLR